MKAFKLAKMTIGSLFKKPETILYPTVKPQYYPGLKGHVEIDVEKCILCGICQKRCPADAITVSKPDSSWSIDPFRCVQCSSCVIECPKAALSMDVNYTAPNTRKATNVFTVTR